MEGSFVLSRRKILRAALATGGFAFMGGAGAIFALRGSAPDVAGLKALTDHEYRTLTALARALFPPGGPVSLCAEDLELARSFDAFLADEPEWNRSDLKNALFLLEFGPVLFERRAKTFSRLPEAERLEHFQSWAESDSAVRRQAALAFRKFLSIVFYDEPEAWADIGYDGPLIGKGAAK